MAFDPALIGKSATFTQMKDGTPPEWDIVHTNAIAHAGGHVERVVAHLQLLDDGGESGYAVDRLTHSLQTATRAHRDGRDVEYVVCALLHDIGDTLGCLNHADIAAAIVKPYVSEQNHFMVEHHAVFQGYYFFEHFGLDRDARERFRGHQWFDYTAEFCEQYDQAAFDPKYDSMTLADFRPMLEQVFSQVKRSIYVKSAAE